MEEFFKGISDRERCIFEAGIKLATAFHQFHGTPVSAKSRESLERAMEQALKNQPFVEEALVKIDESQLGGVEYASLDGKMLDVAVVVKYGAALCRGRLKYIKKEDYPLMYIEEI
jgi:hypothetical protein